jgi:hypothetical protein
VSRKSLQPFSEMRTQDSVKNYYVIKNPTSDAFIAPPAEGNNIFRLVEMIS